MINSNRSWIESFYYQIYANLWAVFHPILFGHTFYGNILSVCDLELYIRVILKLISLIFPSMQFLLDLLWVCFQFWNLMITVLFIFVTVFGLFRIISYLFIFLDATLLLNSEYFNVFQKHNETLKIKFCINLL